MNELFRRILCSEHPKSRVDAAGVAFDRSSLPVLFALDPYVELCRESRSNVDSETYDIPCSDSAAEVVVPAPSSAGHPTSYTRISVAAVVVFFIELLMLLLFDAQLMAVNAVSPEFTYFWIAQLVVASISLLFFTSSTCSRHSRSKFEIAVASVCLLTNTFVITSAAMVVAQFAFTSFQTYALRMAFLACRSFNCAVCVVAFRRQLSECFFTSGEKDHVQRKTETPSKPSQPRIAAVQPVLSACGVPSPFFQNSAQKRCSILKRVTNRLSLLGNHYTHQEYVACSDELMSICQPQNRLLLSVGDVWKAAVPDAFDIISNLSLGGHVVVDCTADGRCGLVEVFSVCSIVCKWLRSHSSNTVVIFHKGSQSCATVLSCCILMASGLSPRCEHAVLLVLLSSTLHEFQDVELARAGSRRMLRHFECFLHAEQHPVRAVPRFLTMIVLKGCIPLPPGFEFSIDVICGGTTKVRSGQSPQSSAVDKASREIECQLSSVGTCTFCLEAGSVLCNGDLEIVILVKNKGNGVSAQVASVLSHSSFCGISGPHVFRSSSAEVDWLGGKQHGPVLFTNIELHFGATSLGNGSYDPTLSNFGDRLLHAACSALDFKAVLPKLLAKASMKLFASGVNLKSDHSNDRSSSMAIVVSGACSVELPHPTGPKSAACALQALSSGQMLPSLKVMNWH